MDNNSKPLQHGDESGFSFVQEMLSGQDNYGINLDRIMYLKDENQFIVFEFQKCEEKQSENGVTPHTSHPKRYWWKCYRKYLCIWKIVEALKAKFYVINYAESGTKHANEVKVIIVENITESGMTSTESCVTRDEFRERFQKLNMRCKE